MNEHPIIFIVDDQPEPLKALMTFLETSGFRIVVAQSGEAALKRIKKNGRTFPDLILLDVLMPDLDGFETCRRIKAFDEAEDIPVLFMTALSETIDKVKGFEAGGVDYLTKPVQHEEVLARVKTHLTLRKLRQQLQAQNVRLQEHNEQLHKEIAIRQQAEAALKASEQRYRAVVEDQTELICRFLPNSTLTFVNEAYCRYFDKTQEELLGKPFFPLIPEADRTTVTSCLIDLNREHPVKTIEHRVILPQGDIGWQQWTNRIIFDEQGNPQEFQGVGRDITELKRVEAELDRYHRELYDLVQERTMKLSQRNEQLYKEIVEHEQTERSLKESEQRYRALYEEAPNAYFSVGADLMITQCNPAASQLLGYSRAELTQMNLLDLFADLADGRPKARTVFQQFLAGMLVHDQELQMQKKDNTTVWISLRMSLVKDWHGQVIECRAMAIDITDRKRQELAIQAERNHLQRENIALRSTLQDRYKFGDLIGKSPAMQQVYELIVKAAATEANVLIQGETGVGKELVAHTIHDLSSRQDKPFVVVNCGAITETLFEREFFGHRKGAFTGADRNKQGYVEAAHQGTLFLDEIGELTPTMQVKLLRVIETHEYTPVGAATSTKADVRIISATNRDLEDLSQQGKLRDDFYYRIRVIPVSIPPLRERREDIPLLIEHFWEQYASSTPTQNLPVDLLEQLYLYDWPGNVRQLQNTLQLYQTTGQVELFGDSETAAQTIIEKLVRSCTSSETATPGLYDLLGQIEKEIILNTLKHQAGKKHKTAEMLGIDRRTLYQKIKKYGLE